MSVTLAIVGRPNVGKSTLFNRLAGKRMAIVHDEPGVTRDRRIAEGQLGDLALSIVDTAGFEESGELNARLRAQTELAVSEADVVLLVMDARAGLTAGDEIFAALLRRTGKPVIVVANKAEARAGRAGIADASRLGFGEPVALSAIHAEGLDTLYEALLPFAREDESDAAEEAEEPPLRLAVIGRPNVGKSSLINRLLGTERFVTGPEAGITRDAIGVTFEAAGRAVKIFDTAGLRRKSRIVDPVERLSAADTLRAVRFAEVVVLVFDPLTGLEKQDLTIADLVTQEGRALVIAVNKWDLVPADESVAARAQMVKALDSHLPQIRGVPLVTLSALTGQAMARLMPAVFEAHRRWQSRVPTAALNRWLEEAEQRHPPPIVQGRNIRLRYVTQAKTRPPTFAFFVSRPADLPESYVRYLANSLREAFDLTGVPVRILLRRGKNPYA